MIVVVVGARGGDNVGGGVMGAGGTAMSALSNMLKCCPLQQKTHTNVSTTFLKVYGYTEMQCKCYGILVLDFSDEMKL